MRPLKAHVYEPHLIPWGKQDVFVQPKLNGIRALYQNGRFQSNDQIPFSSDVITHIAEELRSIFHDDIVLDGELYVHGWKLQKILGAITPVRKEQSDDTQHIQFHIFDVVDMSATFAERFKRVCSKWNSTANTWRVVDHYLCAGQHCSDLYYKSFVEQGYEGMMYRIGSCQYTTPNQPGKSINPRARAISNKENRVYHMLKRKDWQDDEFVCVGMVMGEGKHEGRMGSLTCIASKDFDADHFEGHRFQVGSGFTDLERIEYAQNPPLGHLIKVKYLFLSSDGIPQNPSCLLVLPKTT